MVDARFMGEGPYYPGKIYAQNADGTVCVLFDDGDRDRKVAQANIRERKPRGARLGIVVRSATEAADSKSLQRKKKQSGSKKSRYHGVSWHKCKSRWRAQLVTNKVPKHLGSFHSELDAALCCAVLPGLTPCAPSCVAVPRSLRSLQLCDL